jgi:signal transduction histidine kinase
MLMMGSLDRRRYRVNPPHLSISQKLVGLMAVMITAIVVILTFFFISQRVSAIRAGLISRVSGYGRMLSSQARSAVAFADRETAREVLSPLESDPNIAAVVLFGHRGEELYRQGAPGAWVQQIGRGVEASRLVEVQDRIATLTPVESLEGPVGTLVIEASTSAMQAARKLAVRTAMSAGLAALALGMAAAWLIARSLTRRLRAMARVATNVASGDARVAAVDDRSSDEIGVLAGAFNHMIGQLQGEEERLRTAVRERTAELTAANERLVVEMEERSRVEVELRQAQKLESVGRLASGVAHEINTPVQFVNDSCHFVRDATGDLQRLIEEYRDLLVQLRQGAIDPEAALARAEAAEQDADLPYLLDNIPRAVTRSIDGLDRVAAIVRAMKEFAYPDRKERALADINRAIETTLMVSSNEYKYVADIKTELGEVPQVMCHVGEVNQAVLNIVVNAAHAIQDVVGGGGSKGEIAIRTWAAGSDAFIAIRDTGKGIPREIIDKIFDPFFTTKQVGKGTGQGLAIARSVIVDKHGGKLSVDSEPGHGTTFTICLPIAGVPRPLEEGVASRAS